MMSKRDKSIALRRKGLSVKHIAHQLGASQGSVSTWVRGVVLTPKQKLRLKNYTHSPKVVEKRRQSRLRNELLKKSTSIEESAVSVEKMDLATLKVLGIGLYWGEGSKSTKGMARISNSDPAIISIMMRFFREVCAVKDDRFKGHIHIHSAVAAKQAEKYWSEVTKVPLSQFFKTYIIKSKSSQNIRKTLQYGTLDIGVGDTKLLLKILGWIEGYRRQANQ